MDDLQTLKLTMLIFSKEISVSAWFGFFFPYCVTYSTSVRSQNFIQCVTLGYAPGGFLLIILALYSATSQAQKHTSS